MIFFREALIGSWAGVGVNFGPLLYAGQHANEKNRGSICMLELLLDTKVVHQLCTVILCNNVAIFYFYLVIIVQTLIN
jgi:hypothetical protein